MGWILLDLGFIAYLTKLNENTCQFGTELDGIVTLIGLVYPVQLSYIESTIKCNLTK